MLNPARIIATILEKTLITFLLIIFSVLAAPYNIKKVAAVALTKAPIPTNCFVTLRPMPFTETMTEVIAAGPANKGVARGNTLNLSDVKFILSSFR